MKQKVGDFLFELFHALFRYFNFPHPLGLIEIGNPGRDAPVFLSGNYILTVRRLIRRLQGEDCFLLVANSRGSNVWCAAGMNEFTEYDVIDAIRVSCLADRVRHRRIIAPVLAATGIDREVLRDKTGFKIQWGPTHLDDLPEYISSGRVRSNAMYQARFGLRDRLEQAVATATGYALTIAPALLIWPGTIFKLIVVSFAVHLLVYGAAPLLPEERRWRRTAVIAVIATGIVIAAALILDLGWSQFAFWLVALLAIALLVATDWCGSTPLYKATVAHWFKKGDYDSDFGPVIDPALCINCVQCILVCPRDVFAAVREPDNKTVVAVSPDRCEECLACCKQCPTDAIFSRGGSVKGDVKTIPNLAELAARDWSHLKAEDRWIGRPTELRKSIPVVTLDQSDATG